MKILTVDDRAEDLYLLNKMLEGKGYEVIGASNGKEALKKLADSKPDLVISDILMPEMDGYQLLKEVKSNKEFSKIPFVFYTATYTSKKDEKFAYSLGASRFIVKPTEPKEFVKLIDKTLKDQSEGILSPTEPTIEKEEVYLKEYNERLIQRLEETVTSLELARDEIKGSRDFLQSIVDSIQDGIIYVDVKGKVGLANKNGKKLQDEILKKVLPALEDSGECSCEFEICSDDRYYDPSCFSVNAQNKMYLGTTIVLRDITERRIAQEELKARVDELEKWQRLTVGREIKMIDLKKQVKSLEKKVGRSKKKKKK